MSHSQGAKLIEQERRRQQQEEWWSVDHDDTEIHDELVLAAVQYALPDERREYSRDAIYTRVGNGTLVPINWPWENLAWNPTPDDRVRELVKAGALIAAEIDRLLRAEKGGQS